MRMDTDTQQVSVDAKQLGHEPLTLSVRGLVIFVVCFIASAVVIHIVVWRLYRGSMQQEQSNDARRSALISQRPPPAGPALQPSPAHEALPQQDLAALRAAENAEFAKRGWLDESTGEVRVPDDIIQKVAAMTAPGATTQP
jgi:hypothetical protein